VIDALGDPQSVLVLGGSSEIALATVKALPRNRINRVVLAGRASAALTSAVEELTNAGAKGVVAAEFDATNMASHERIIDEIFDAGDIDIVILAFGMLGDQMEFESDPNLAVQIATTNYTGAVSSGLHVARRLRKQGHGSLVVISSVAGDRARRSNYVYGSTKAGLDAFAQGLGDALQGSGAHVMVVRPGMVRTRMTAGMPEAPMTTDAPDVAKAIIVGLRKGKHTIYAPSNLRYLMGVVKTVPRPIFRKLPS
jgi:decaprenylphospho-beta-D-erythro-pentofuranosid-2-ulose 2-reductase